jgi:tetratricopeptide (TPR) repeat protein
LSDLLRRIREDRRVHLPKLLLLEAQTLRLLSDRDEANYDEAMRRTALAIEVLQSAEDMLMVRRATDARNQELINVWTTRAAVHGYVIGAYLRRISEQAVVGACDESEMARLRSEIFFQLHEVELYAGRTRSLGMPSFFPLDVNYWSQRDVLQMLPGLSESERLHLLARMASILDTANEEPIEPRQSGRLLRRQSELAALEGNIALSEDIAERMRRDGDFGGWCQLIRRDVYQPGSRVPSSGEAARSGLYRLLSLGGEVWRDREATTLAHHLWMWGYLPHGQIGADPLLGACKAEHWEKWRRILVARKSFPEDEDNAFADFNTAIQLDRRNPEGWAYQGLVLERRGDRERASRSFAEAVRLDPDFEAAKNGLARTRGSG